MSELGHAINDHCRFCVEPQAVGGRGLLRPVFGDDGKIVFLVCSGVHCGLLYGARDRGRTVDDLIKEQIPKFVHPDRMPGSCPACYGKLEQRHLVVPAREPGRGLPHDITSYQCCTSCFTLAWLVVTTLG